MTFVRGPGLEWVLLPNSTMFWKFAMQHMVSMIFGFFILGFLRCEVECRCVFDWR